MVGKIKPQDITYCRVSTNDSFGYIKAYLGEGAITSDQVNTFGGYGVVRIPNFQKLLAHICDNGYEHHVALNPSRVGSILEEAFDRYLGWDVYHHQG